MVEGNACSLVTDILISFDYTGYSRFAGRNLKPKLPRPTSELWTFRTRTTKHSIATFKVVVPLGDADVEWCGMVGVPELWYHREVIEMRKFRQERSCSRLHDLQYEFILEDKGD